MLELRRLLFCGFMIFIYLPALAQQSDINRYTLFTGFDYMISPARNLTERGFESDFGVTVRPWLGLGGDFGILGADVIRGAKNGHRQRREQYLHATRIGSGSLISSQFRALQIDGLGLRGRPAILSAQVGQGHFLCPSRFRRDPREGCHHFPAAVGTPGNYAPEPPADGYHLFRWFGRRFRPQCVAAGRPAV